MRLRCFLLDVDYITLDSRAVIRLWLKDELGRNIIAYDPNFEPYFYAVTDDADAVMSVVSMRSSEEVKPNRVERVVRRDFGEPVTVLKVYVEHPQHVPILREKVAELGVSVREADILFAVRYIIDRELVPMDQVLVEGSERADPHFSFAIDVDHIEAEQHHTNPDLKVMAFDCEMLSHGGVPIPNKDPIIIISIATGADETTFLSVDEDKDDKRVIADFISFIHEYDPDVIVGYNTDEFDWQYLKTRAEKFKLRLTIGRDESPAKFSAGGGVKEVRIFGRSNVDLYKVVKRDISELSVKTLDNVADYMGVMRKSERVQVQGWDMARYWNDPELRRVLFDYSKADVVSTWGVAERLLPLQFEFARIVRQPLDDVSGMGRGRQVESLLVAEAYKINEIVPAKGGGSGSYAGGFVLFPKPGVHEDVLSLDFSSMYPSIMISYNISPDTVMSPDETSTEFYEAPKTQYRFRKHPDGFFKIILTNLIERRRAVREQMTHTDKGSRDFTSLDVHQNAIKILTNAFYGYTGWHAAKWYRKECAEATTAWGRTIIQDAVERAEKHGLEVIYGDTDSLFVKLKEA
ncbi:MAG TPA: DNA-directed DNA polymerase [Candidatus Bathyarchaeia archaeon]|nr:DNA-directed DNA polymerase [Candidatus Bathyarchaeia archaeon]